VTGFLQIATLFKSRLGIHAFTHNVGMKTHNKYSRNVSPITDSLNLQVPICTDTLGHENVSNLCLRNIAMLVVNRSFHDRKM